ncbi:hypothetical protein [Frankia tisae]|uniref:hypothetical protein n=1 Tax=Frankia tisae TaxID=2950104 RepID=UPI0021C0F060|nr:hypothetical protein [Frankia tisae]
MTPSRQSAAAAPARLDGSSFARRIYLSNRDVLGTRIASKDETVMLPAVLDTGRQT